MAFKIGDLELATPGDIFIGGLAYGAAFTIDAFFFPDGANSAEVANAATIAALGTKYGVQTAWQRWRKNPRRRLLPKVTKG
ncbi:MAG: hypothetical protein M3461_11760 [Pseudomonadota bacterium]|nr:hypothetical protein [Pseudomonadota bacterium]